MPAPTSVPRRAAPNAGMTCSFGAIAKVVVAVSNAENPTHSSVVVWRGSATVEGLHEISFRYFDRIVVLVRLVAVVADTPAPPAAPPAPPFSYRRRPAVAVAVVWSAGAPANDRPTITFAFSSSRLSAFRVLMASNVPMVVPTEASVLIR